MVWMNCFALIAANDVGASVSTTVSPWNNSSGRGAVGRLENGFSADTYGHKYGHN